MRCLIAILGCLGLLSSAWSQEATATGVGRAQLEVTGVRFAFATAPEASARWLEIAVDVRVQPPAGNFVDRPRVTLSLATKSTAGERALTHYRASVTAVTAERGTARFRFYLPPEIVRRDALSTDIELWRVELHAGEQLQPFAPAGVSASLRDALRLREFLQRLDAEAPANEGVLQPQHLTPFLTSYPNAAPTVLRKDVR